MIEKVVSGGQTGVDQAALKAAASLKPPIKTGGWMPRGFKTLDGPNPQLADKYGLLEHSSSSYKERTWDNVRESDGTLRIATTFKSMGEKCTLKAIESYDRPYFDIDLRQLEESGTLYIRTLNAILLQFQQWVGENNIHVLNVAGNSEKTSPGIYDKSLILLTKLLI